MHLTEQPLTASLSHFFRDLLQLPRDSYLCVVNDWGLQEHKITEN